MQRTHYETFLMGTGTTLRQIINMTTDSQIIDHPKRWKYMVYTVFRPTHVAKQIAVSLV